MAAVSRWSLGLSGACAALAVYACGNGSTTSGFDDRTDGGSSSDGGAGGGEGGGGGFGTDGGGEITEAGGGTTTTTTTIYANTDDSLYTLDPKTQAVTLVGKFSGTTDNVTDIAVNANGDVYVNTQTDIYSANVPSSPGTVKLTHVAKIVATKSQAFFALAFAPAGVLGTGEALVGGDGVGELWSIDPISGATKELGYFGKDPSDSSKVLALSGDIVFYTDQMGKPTGLATVRACSTGGTSCSKTDDFLAGIDMTALAAAYASGTPAGNLLSGIYGGSSGKTGPGIGQGEIFGLGAWEGSVFGFSRSQSGSSPQLLTVDATSGKGSPVAGSSFSFTNGWSGAGVSTKTTVTIPPPASVK